MGWWIKKLDFKREVFLILVVVTVGILTYLIALSSRPCEIYSKIATPVIEVDSKLTISQKLTMAYLGAYKHKKTCITSWLSDYRVNEIKINQLSTFPESVFVVPIDFSVKPIGKSKYWFKNSEVEEDGWIKKSVVLTIVQEDGFYKIDKVFSD